MHIGQLLDRAITRCVSRWPALIVLVLAETTLELVRDALLPRSQMVARNGADEVLTVLLAALEHLWAS